MLASGILIGEFSFPLKDTVVNYLKTEVVIFDFLRCRKGSVISSFIDFIEINLFGSLENSEGIEV